MLHNQGNFVCVCVVSSLSASSALKCSLTPRQNYLPWQLKAQPAWSCPLTSDTLLVGEVATVSRLPVDHCDEVRLCRGSARALTINYGSNTNETLSIVCSQWNINKASVSVPEKWSDRESPVWKDSVLTQTCLAWDGVAGHGGREGGPGVPCCEMGLLQTLFL